MARTWYSVRLDVLERLALAELAQRAGETEDVTLNRLVRQAAKQALLETSRTDGKAVQSAGAEVAA